MQKPTHTPKPWRVGFTKSGNLAVWGDESHRQQGYSECCICLIAPPGQITPIDHANGALIKAAPELLEALKACALVLAGENMAKNGLIDALEKARAAIAKAKS